MNWLKAPPKPERFCGCPNLEGRNDLATYPGLIVLPDKPEQSGINRLSPDELPARDTRATLVEGDRRADQTCPVLPETDQEP